MAKTEKKANIVGVSNFDLTITALAERARLAKRAEDAAKQRKTEAIIKTLKQYKAGRISSFNYTANMKEAIIDALESASKSRLCGEAGRRRFRETLEKFQRLPF